LNDLKVVIEVKSSSRSYINCHDSSWWLFFSQSVAALCISDLIYKVWQFGLDL